MILLVAATLLLGSRQTAKMVGTEPYRWRNVAVVAGGFISGIKFHPAETGLAYARTDIGGAYRWESAKSRWIPLLDWLTKPDWNLYGIESMAIDPKDPTRLYLACGTYTNQWGSNGAILRSKDQGRSFERTDLPFKCGGNEDGRSMGERLAVDPQNGKLLFFGSRNNGLWKSTDGAVTWSQVASFPVTGRTNGIGVEAVTFERKFGIVFAAAASRSGSLYASLDKGDTWFPVPGQPKGAYVHQMQVVFGTLYATYSDNPGPNGITDGAVWKLDIETNRWTDITPAKPHSGSEGSFGYAGLSVDPDDPNRLAVSTLDRWNPGDDVFRSADGGSHWFSLRQGSSRDASAAPYMTWGKPAASFGWWTGALAVDPFDPRHVLYGTGANIWASRDVPATYKSGASPPTHWYVGGVGIEETADIDLLSPATGPHFISALGDIGGFTHSNLSRPAPSMTLHPQLDNTDSLADASLKPETLVRVGRPDGKQMHGGYSLDAGETWTAFPTEPPGIRAGGSATVTADGRTFIWSPERRSIWLSSNKGESWKEAKGGPLGGQVVADRTDPQVIYALGSDGKFFASGDTGAQFLPVETAHLPKGGRMRTVPGRRGDIWFASDTGVFHSTDVGLTFSKIDGIDSADGLGFGKAAPHHAYPAVFLNGRIQGQFGVFRSDDAGRNWVKITDPAHEYGTRGAVIGDPRIYGRVYMGTNGRGVLYADPLHVDLGK